MKNLGDFPIIVLSSIGNNLSTNDLYTCTLINKRFYNATNPVLWRAPNVRTGASLFKVTTGLFLSQHSLATHIRKLDFGMEIDGITFLLLLKQINFLEELKIHQGTSITDYSFQDIPQHCPLLKTLYLNEIYITHRSTAALGEHCHQLSELTLSYCPALSPPCFLDLAHCPLTTLTIISSGVQDPWMTTTAVQNLTHLNLLTFLTIEFASTTFTQCLLTMNNDPGLAPWPHLTYLYLKKCGNFDDQHTTPFIKSHPKIRQFYLCESGITDETLDIISTYIPHATEIGIDDNPQITTHAIRQLICDQPLLTYIACNGCAKGKADFPEADDDEHGNEGILFLGMDTINKIRLGANSGDGN
jgi:hypothetical protein